jgi:hypothetical protein
LKFLILLSSITSSFQMALSYNYPELTCNVSACRVCDHPCYPVALSAGAGGPAPGAGGGGGDGGHELERLDSEVTDVPNNPSFLPTPAPAPGGGAAGGGAGGVGAYVAKFRNINVKDMSVHEIVKLLKVNKSLRAAAEIIAKSHPRGGNLAKPMKNKRKK